MSAPRPGRALLAIALLAVAGAAHADGSLVVASRGLASVLVRGEGAPSLPRGERLRVLRDGRTIGEIEVTASSAAGASCRIVSQTQPAGAGDRVVRAAPLHRPSRRPCAPDNATAAPGSAAPPAAEPAITAPTAAAMLADARPTERRPSPPAYTALAPPASGGSTIAATPAPKPVGVSATTQAPATKPDPPAVAPPAAAAATRPVAVAAARQEPATKPGAPAAPPVAASIPAPAPSAAADSSAAAKPAPAAADSTLAKQATTDAKSTSTATARFAVKYRSASNVYLDGGRAQGIGPTDRLRIFSGATVVAELEVVYAAEQSASCRIVSETRPVQAGDVAVRLTPAAGLKALAAATTASPTTGAAAAAVTPGPPRTASGRPSGPWARVRGSASFGYYRTWDQTASNYDFQERTGRVDLGVYDISGQPLSFTLRGRSRQDIRARTLSDRTPQSERTDRLYEVALRYEPASDDLGLEVGRIGIYRFVGIGYLDGVLARFRPAPLLQVGGFAGRNADVETLGFGGTGRKLGGFLRLAPGGRWATGAYDATLAFVREDADGDVSREYLSLESRFGGGRRWSIFERAELDLNTGWRQEVSGKSYQLSNVSLSGNLRVAPSAWAFVSYDGRRNYRYYLNRVVPEEVFDDLLHQGLRAGVNLNRPGGFGATAGFGMSLKEPDPRNPELEIANAYSFNGGVRHAGLFGSQISASVDFSAYSNGYTDGGLLLARLGRRFAGGHMIDLSYGRSAYRVKLNEEDRTTQFFRLMGRGELGRRVYVQGDFEYDSGDDLQGPRGFLELGILF